MDQSSASAVFTSSRRSRAFERARDAVLTLQNSRPELSPQDEETLGMLIDKSLMSQLDASLREAKEGKIEPLESILDAQ